ncbi:DEAD/DEAH box helicase [Patulibacter defluvii]|uniref:DEAD/DEAH box helicase n=1 Tax=Patulibacter defluvii TaxID=3095358 RepID=UPI002A757817|nr:DEAD/DEAH box helicase [Patulibacter sp. DM4]
MSDDAPNPNPTATTFADLALDPRLLTALTALGYEEPTPIQREAIGPLMEGRDLLGQAATGTGKTAAFALPLLQRFASHTRTGKPFALVLTPTRELAMQVSEAIHKYGSELGTRVLPVYGGTPIVRQLRTLERGVDVVVATPGRAVDLLNRRALDLSDLRTVVLDEADEMLDMGFAEDLDALLDAVPEQRQAVLFSATMPRRIDRMAQRRLRDPIRIQLEAGADGAPGAGEAPRIRQTAYVVPRAHKPAALGRVLDVEQPNAAIVFCRTRAEVDELTATLNGRGYRAEALHGGIDQEGRSRVVERLRGGTTELVVATDVAARGLDVDILTHVVNYDVPSAPEAYVHRIGRVGRAGREGVAITLAQPREHRLVKAIERLTGQKIAIEVVPTVADLRARRLEATRERLRESLLRDEDRSGVREVVEALAEEFDLIDVALAAIKLAHDGAGGVEADDEEIPDAGGGWRRDGRERPGRGDRRERDGGGRWEDRRGGGRDDRGRDRHDDRRGPRPGGGPGLQGPTTRLFVSAGRRAGIRPKDIVGAFTGESSLTGRDIGTIQIHDRFSLVEVPESRADETVRALQGLTMKGRRTHVRR